MFYTIMYAINASDNSVKVDFSKSGNKFVISAWNRGECKTVERREFSRYDDAETAFHVMRKRYGTPCVKEPEQDWDATDFD